MHKAQKSIKNLLILTLLTIGSLSYNDSLQAASKYPLTRSTQQRVFVKAQRPSQKKLVIKLSHIPSLKDKDENNANHINLNTNGLDTLITTINTFGAFIIFLENKFKADGFLDNTGSLLLYYSDKSKDNGRWRGLSNNTEKKQLDKLEEKPDAVSENALLKLESKSRTIHPDESLNLELIVMNPETHRFRYDIIRGTQSEFQG